MKRKILFVILIIAVGAFSFAGGEQEVDKIVIATDATWPPMEFINEDKELVGFDIDLMKEIAKEGGFEYEFKNTAWDGIFAGLANEEYDAVMSSVTITEERKKTMDFSVPYVNAGQILFVQKSTMGVETLADMSGKSVGAQIGTTGAFAIQDAGGVNLRTYDELGLAVEDLANGRIDGVVADSPTAVQFVLLNDNYKDQLKIVGEPFTDEYYGIAVKKGNTEVLEKINKGLEAVLDTPRYERIEDKWLR